MSILSRPAVKGCDDLEDEASAYRGLFSLLGGTHYISTHHTGPCRCAVMSAVVRQIAFTHGGRYRDMSAGRHHHCAMP